MGAKTGTITPELTGLSAENLFLIDAAFRFMRACAASHGIPRADEWELSYRRDMVFRWRIVDATAPRRGDETRNTVRAFKGHGRSLVDEIEAYGYALRAATELRDTGVCPDLMSEAARNE